MRFDKALQELRNVGCANAAGDALRAMYAQLLVQLHGGKQERYFDFLCGIQDKQITKEAKRLCKDRGAAWDALMA